MSVVDSVARVELVARARDRDQGAFTTLVAPRLEPWLRIATAILGREADALDALQFALTTAWTQLCRLREAEKFEVWVTRILVNECRRSLRRRSRRRLREVSFVADAAIESVAGGARDIGAALGDRVALERAFERLPADARALLVLHHLEGHPVNVIAEVLSVPAGTVKSRLHAARRALEQELIKEQP